MLFDLLFEYDNREFLIKKIDNKQYDDKNGVDAIAHISKDGYIFSLYYGIDENTDEIAEYPCAIDVCTPNNQYDAIYHFMVGEDI